MSIFRTIKAAIFALPFCLAAAAPAQAAPEANANGDTLQEKLYGVFGKNKDSVVMVYAQKNIVETNEHGVENEHTTLDVGSGFLIGKDGTVMTSAYVTYAANKIWIKWRGIMLDAESVGFDPLTSVSIVRIKGDFKSNDANIIQIDGNAGLPPAATMLMGISYEMGLPPSPRWGLVSGHNIEFGGAFLPTVYLRSTICAPRGTTGGAVFDMNGKFVGMTIAALPEISGSFILPAKSAARIRDDILLSGEPVYSWFGLRAEDAEGVGQTRVVVNFVAENAPAKKAGFIVGDEILEINAKKVINNTELRESTFFVRPGETAVFKVKRGEDILRLEVLAERMSPEIVQAAEANLMPSMIGRKGGSEQSKHSKNPADNKSSKEEEKSE